MKRIEEVFSDEIRSVAIAGHVNPDADCVGSCCALYLYPENAMTCSSPVMSANTSASPLRRIFSTSRNGA